MDLRSCYKEVFLFTAMVSIECVNVGINIVYKAATLKGISSYVFVVYSFAVATLVLFPFAFFFRSSTTVVPANKFPLISRICLLGLLGCMYRLFCFKGALVVVLYKGQTILSTSSSTNIPVSLQWPLGSSQSNWVLGGLFITAEYLLYSTWLILQTEVIKKYPAKLVVVFLYNFCGTIISALICSMAEPDLNAWRLRSNIAIAAVIFSGVGGLFLMNFIYSWALYMKGPIYVAIFKPLSIVIAIGMGVIFLGDALYLGSGIGAVIISIGFYVVIWGKANDEINEDDSSFVASNSKTPLLQSSKVEDA